VPVPLAGRGVDHLAGTDLDDLAVAALDRPDAVGDVQGLSHGMALPGGAGAEADADGVDSHPGWL